MLGYYNNCLFNMRFSGTSQRLAQCTRKLKFPCHSAVCALVRPKFKMNSNIDKVTSTRDVSSPLPTDSHIRFSCISNIYPPRSSPLLPLFVYQKEKTKAKTYNSRYSLVVTHPTTNLPIQGLSSGERTGSSVLLVLWSYVKVFSLFYNIYHNLISL